MKPQRRAHRRTNLQREVLVAPVREQGPPRGLYGDGDLDQPAVGTMRDVGCGGLAVELDASLEVGTAVDVHIKGSDGMVQRARGKVSNTRVSDGALTIGIAFDQPLVTLGAPRADDAGPIGVGDQKPRALVVDDDEGVRIILTRFLESQGLEVVTADSGATALPMIREQPPSLLLLDLRMPEMGGIELLEALQAESLRVPHVWAMSGMASDEEATRAMALGAEEFLNKPFDLELIAERLRLLSVAL